MDDDALFYLRSRGIDETTARGLLVHAFIGDAIDQIGHEPSREAFRQVVDGWLADEGLTGRGEKDDGR